MRILSFLLFVACLAFTAGLALPQSTSRLPAPSQAAQADAMKLLRDIFGDDLAKATNSADQAKLAAYLFQQGKQVKDDDAVRYVCFREARDLAAKANETSLALAIVDEMSRVYEMDALQAKADVLGLAAASARDKDAGLALVELIRPLLNEAVDLDQYKAAHQLGDALVAAAKKAKSPSLVLELQKRVDEITATEKNFAKLQGYLIRLQKNPADAEANLELGKYFGYQKKRWEKALPYFASSSDAGIVKLAKQDLAMPVDTKEQLALADGWWDYAGKESGGAKLAVQMRAMFWYEKAIPSLAGLNRTKAQKRIELAQESLSGTAAPALPVVAGPVGEFRKFEGHSDEVKGVAFSHDSRYAASCSRDTSIRIWDLAVKETKEMQVLRGHAKEVWSVQFHPNNRYLLSASWDATARMWDFKTGMEVKRFQHAKDVNGLALSRDGGMMLTGSDDEKAYLWNLSTGDEIRRFTGQTNYVYAVAFAPDGRHIATGGVDKTVRIFDLAGQLVKTFPGQSESVTNVAFTADSRQVLSSGDSAIHLWDVATGNELPRRFEGHQGRISAMALSPDGRRLVTGGDDRTVKYWDVATGKMLHSFTGHADSVSCVAFSWDGRRVISGSYDRTVRVWNLPAR